MTNAPKDGDAAAAPVKLRAVGTDPPRTHAPPAPPVPETPAKPDPAPAAPAARTPPGGAVARRRRAALAAAKAAAGRDPAGKAPAPEAAPEARPGPALQPGVRPAAMRSRHWVALASFLAVVVLPFLAAAGYLYLRAADQYHSEVAFSIRSEEAGSAAAGLLGAITQIGSGSASDPDILFEYIRSQRIVEEIDRDLDLRAIFGRAEGDPVFSLQGPASIEDLVAHWRGMVEVAFESSSGIIHVRANAFAPEDARAISRAVLSESSALVNRLSEQAREDAVRFARDELQEADDQLRRVRQRLTDFRRDNRIVDPSADAAGQMGLLNALQGELAQALVERDVLLSFVGEEDQRVIQGNRRITAISQRIEQERASLGIAGATGALPQVIGAYEELLVDLEFANTAYTQALGGLAAARAEARRQSRYLAPHIEPTLAERALYPRRALLAGLMGLFLLLGWGILMLLYYNVRDNR